MNTFEKPVIWFRATDIPLRKDNPFQIAEKGQSKSPIVWERFSDFDSALLEQTYLDFKSNPKIATPIALPYALDGLFEVNISLREVYPIYWDGPIFEVRRGIWFEPKGSSYIPCEENLTVQLEDGLKKYSQLHAVDGPNPASDWKWPLLGPYLSQMVSYESSKKVCWIQSDYITEKLARALTQSAGTKLIRGWDEVQALSQKKNPKKKEEEVSVSAKKIGDTQQTSETGPVVDVTPSLENMANITKMRKIDHLVFVIHGIGQKLSATMGTGLTFINDCDVLRNGLKDSSKQLLASLKASKNDNEVTLSDECGVQVIPIHWRQKLNVEIPGTSDDHLDPNDEEYEDRLTLGDIMPEGIPGIRMLISDVILDVLLYMTPKYRKEMINHVSNELNRVYRLFQTRNPNFSGSVSIYGHSLGSVIAFDIATHQNFASEDKPTASRPQSAGIDLSDVLGSGSILNSRLGGLIIEENVVFDAPKLDFDIVNLYSVGSPIGMFLFLAGLAIRPPLREGQEEEPRLAVSRPCVKSLYNIYHAYDPVAHRIEPLVSSKLTTLRPFNIPYTKGGLTKTVKGIEQAGTEVYQRGKDLLSGLYSSAGNMIGTFSSLSGKVIPATQEVPQVKSEVELDDMSRRNSVTDQRRLSINSNSSPTHNLRPAGLQSDGNGTSNRLPNKKASDVFNKTKPILHPDPNPKQKLALDKISDLNPYGRLDFVLQESILENPYLSSIAVHMNYWNDSDVNSLIIRSLYNLTSEL